MVSAGIFACGDGKIHNVVVGEEDEWLTPNPNHRVVEDEDSESGEEEESQEESDS